MSNNPFRIADLINAYFQRSLGVAEAEELDVWLNADENNRKFFNELSDEEALRDKLSLLNHVKADATWNKTLKGIRNKQPVYLKFRRRMAIAASIMMIVGLGIWWGTHFRNTSDNRSAELSTKQTKTFEDIAPGSIGATLTLANGKKIILSAQSDGKLASEAGILISKTADGQLVYEIQASTAKENSQGLINTLSTANGQTYMVTLPDKSKVWLNAASSLSFSAGLINKGIRKVNLSGEAYFEVAKNSGHPFVVASQGQQVEVLGTHFNVNSYGDESNTRTTLLEGAVRVASDGGKTVVLRPGQQSAVSGNGLLTTSEVDTEPIVAWKNGLTSFRNAEIKTIMQQISRWYDVDIRYAQGIPGKLFSGEIPRNANLSELMKVLEFSGIRLKVENRTITVLP